MKDMFVTGRFLLTVCAVAALSLAATEQVTAPRIARFKKEELERAKKSALPAAVEFSDVVLPVKLPDGSLGTKTVFIGFDEKKKIAGVVQTGASKGYAGPINLVVGLDPELKLVNLKVATPNETPGLGTKLKEEDFLGKFLNQCKTLGTKMVYTLKKDGGSVDGITAATISSRAFCRGIREMVDFAKENRSAIFSASPGETPFGMPQPKSAPGVTPEPSLSPDTGVVSPTAPETGNAPNTEPTPVHITPNAIAPETKPETPALPAIAAPGTSSEGISHE
jgi:electron transport complex protein RnfG